MATIRIPQADGGVRVIAVSSADAARVADDRTLIECVTVLGSVDIQRSGWRMYGLTGPLWRDVTESVRAELRSAS